MSMPQESNPHAAASPAPAQTPALRLASIDAYRGLAMFLMMGEVLSFRAVSRRLPDNPIWKFLCDHQSHVEWVGCSLHDMIQPSFSFLVGVALPFSLAGRLARGNSKTRVVAHALWRSLILVFLGVFLRSRHGSQTHFTFEDTLSQIGLGYPWLFLLALYSVRVQLSALAVVLIGYWGAFAVYPAPGPAFDFAAVGVGADWPHPTGFAAHWDKNSNLAWAFDVWFLNLFPRESVFKYNGGGYSTLSFIPTLGTMIMGLLAGGVLKSPRPAWSKIGLLVVAGGLAIALGWGLGALGVCPVVKRIWTPSWTLYSGGICLIALAVFYLILDLAGVRFWAFPLRVIGMNSIAAYCMAGLFESFIGHNLTIHLGKAPFQILGGPYEPLLHGAGVLLVLWLILFWMYRNKIFLRV